MMMNEATAASSDGRDDAPLHQASSGVDETSETLGLITQDDCSNEIDAQDVINGANRGRIFLQFIHNNNCRTNKYLAAASTLFLATSLYLAAGNDRLRFYLQRHEHRHNNANQSRYYGASSTHTKKKKSTMPKSYPAFPAKALLGVTPVAPSKGHALQLQSTNDAPYDPLNDFQYGHNRTLLYWEEVVEAIEQYKSPNNLISSSSASSNNVTLNNGTVWSNLSTWGACYPRALPGRRLRASKPKPVNRNWTSIVESNADSIDDETSIIYPQYKKDYFHNEDEMLGGQCRPGFLIIGQGKCGTSSLYHYITGHPRVLPASEKQIHYFLYHTHQSLKWYYSHFPSIESFLGRGVLMTGEASPGYMPYPSVLERVVKRLSPTNAEEDGEKKGLEVWRDKVQSLPKIIAIVREPIDRAVSSYKYNYITPALKRLRSGIALSANGESIPGGRSDVYYLKHNMFSLEELARAELKILRQCLKPGGQGERYTRNRYAKHNDSFFYESIRQRMGSDSPNFIHLDGACYQESSSLTIPRVQWTELGKAHPNKVLALPDLQLIQSILGRSLYTFPLEWWYEVFESAWKERENRIHIVCNEDMANYPVQTMENVTEFLGLPKFDSWSDVTDVGRYNVGGHRGYDTITQVTDEVEDESAPSGYGDTGVDRAILHLTNISDSFRNELIEFYRPYNERLFNLIGKRCHWD